MKKSNTSLMQEIRRDLNAIHSINRKSLTESVFGDDDFPQREGEEMGDEGGMNDRMAQKGNPGNEDMSPVKGELPSEQQGTTGDGEIDNILSNIRLAVIKGLAKLAEKPESIEYDTLKKILTIVDKPIDQQQRQNAAQQQPQNNMR